MDIRWTYTDIGVQPFPATVTRRQYGRHHCEWRTGAWCRFDQRPTNHPHHHDGFYEFCMITEGTGAFSHADQRLELGPGSILVADPGVIHEVSSVAGDLVLIYWTLRIESCPPFGEATWHQTFIDRFVAGHASLTGGQHALFSVLSALADGGGPLPGLRREELLCQLGLEACAALLSEVPIRPDPEEDDHVVARAVAWIDAHLTEGLSTRMVAASVGLSDRHLRRLFHAKLGTTVGAVITERRFNAAAQHLLMGMTARAAAHAIGISDASQFGRQFKRRFGCTPRDYQRRQSVEVCVPRTTHRVG